MTGNYILIGQTPLLEPDVLTWAQWIETADRKVAKDQIGEASVSTVFLGIDHNWESFGPPLLFETMVFGGPQDGEQLRYSTWKDAEQGHAQVVESLKKDQENSGGEL